MWDRSASPGRGCWHLVADARYTVQIGTAPGPSRKARGHPLVMSAQVQERGGCPGHQDTCHHCGSLGEGLCADRIKWGLKFLCLRPQPRASVDQAREPSCRTGCLSLLWSMSDIQAAPCRLPSLAGAGTPSERGRGVGSHHGACVAPGAGRRQRGALPSRSLPPQVAGC